MTREHEREQRVASKIADLVNSSLSEKEIAKAMTQEHRTLQQTFTRLAIEWLKVCASDDYRYDERNGRSHYIAKEIVTAYDHNHTETTVEFFNDISIPMI